MTSLHTLFETPATARMDASAYLDHPQSEQKSDLIEGVFVMTSPASFQHERILSFVFSTLSFFVESKGLGQVLGSNAAFRLSDQNVFQPDVSFVARDRLHLARDVYFPGPPDIAVEIVSPGSRHYDYVEKKINCGRFGVREYWLIDPLQTEATFFRQVGGVLLPILTEPGIMRSELLAGYWLKVEWLFPGEGDERPAVQEVARLHGLI